MPKPNNILSKLLIWRIKNVSDKNFVMGVALLIGAFGALSAWVLKTGIFYTQEYVINTIQTGRTKYLQLALPFIGIFLTVALCKFLVKRKIGSGIVRILQSISTNKSEMRGKGTWAYLVTSTLTVSFGGSAGLEAPIVATGASIGSNLGKLFHLSYKDKTLLLGCGAAAAIAAIFNAPVTGVIFALEVLMLDLTMSSMIPLLLASVSGATFARVLIGTEVLLNVELTEEFIPGQFAFFILLGLLTGIISFYFTKVNLAIASFFNARKGYLRKTMIGGVLLGVIILAFPPLFGDGYYAIKAILTGNPDSIWENSFFFEEGAVWKMVLFLFLTLILKAVATGVTIGSGGVGGVFAPALFMGGISGFIFARITNLIGVYEVSEKNFTLVGMAGVIGGVQHAPLTAIFLVSELSNGYDLFIPLMITASAAYLTTKFFSPYSIYTGRLQAEKALITHNKDQAVITLMDFKKLIEKNFAVINVNENLREVVKAVSKSSRNTFPVVNNDKEFLGVIELDDIRDVMFNSDLYDEIKVEDLMHPHVGVIDMKDDKEDVLQFFRDTGAWIVPVLENKKYVGFISRSKLFSEYRRMIAKFSED